MITNDKGIVSFRHMVIEEVARLAWADNLMLTSMAAVRFVPLPPFLRLAWSLSNQYSQLLTVALPTASSGT